MLMIGRPVNVIEVYQSDNIDKIIKSTKYNN